MRSAQSRLILEARERAELSQSELATRAGTSQSAIARLESGRANPSMETLSRILESAGFALRLSFDPLVHDDPVVAAYRRDIDRTLLRENLRRSVAERLEGLHSMGRLSTKLRRDSAPMNLEVLLCALSDAHVEFVLVGGVAARAHGSARFTQDADIAYARSRENLARVVTALEAFEPYLRGAPRGLPFAWSIDTVKSGLNFELTSTAGDIDLMAEIPGGGRYEDLLPHSTRVRVYEREIAILDLPWLIHVKRAAGRVRDLEAVAELEALLEERDRLDER